jgi:hypothetical protein
VSDRSSDGSGSKNNSHTITLIRGVEAPRGGIDLYGRLIPAAGRNQTQVDRHSQFKNELNQI